MATALNVKWFSQKGENPDGRDIVILHGLMGSYMNWASIARTLAKTHSVLAYDARNHGSSEHCASMQYEDLAADLGQVIHENNLKAPILLGHSMGGKTSMIYSLLHPEDVGALILVDIGTRPYDPEVRDQLIKMNALDLSNVQSRPMVDEVMAEIEPNERVRQFFMQNLKRTSKGFMWRVNLEGIIGSYNRVLKPLAELVPEHAVFPGPVLAIKGSLSKAVEGIEDFQPWFPEVRLESVENAGHWPQAENPEQTSLYISEFVNSI
jgi:esterase